MCAFVVILTHCQEVIRAGSYDNNDETESIFYFSITESGSGHVLALMDVECGKVGLGGG